MVVGYHRVADRDDPMTVRTSIFAKHVGWLAADRAHVPVVEIDDAVRRPAFEWPRRAVAVTFDDAWQDVYANALPLLTGARIPSTLYVPSRLIGGREYMTRAQVLECAAAGMRIGGHSRTHVDLRACNDAELERELRGCREDLEDLLGEPMTRFAYPFGHLDQRVRAAVVAAGFTSAVSTQRAWARPDGDAMRIPRNFIEDFDVETFRAALRGGLNMLRAVDAVRRKAG
jgi:peptidoglycan/xylan/chitin deacetylase (PgdA/CDA1 family)